MTEPTTITLAGQPYTVQPLTLGQIEDLSVAVVVPDSEYPADNVRRSFQRSIDAIVVALSVDHPDMTSDALRKMRITRQELRDAYGAVLRLSGLVAAEGDKPGEERAGADSTGN